jgi:molybdopterin synthase sulfur carrier subunit
LARVQLSSSLKPYTGGATELEIEAANVRQMLQRLGERYPELRPHLEQGIAVAIDGVIYQDALLQPIVAGSEVFLIDRITGG